MKPISDKKCEELATEIFEWLVNNELWVDVCIYFNGKRWSTHNRETEEYYYNQHKYYEDEADPRDYFDYVKILLYTMFVFPNMQCLSFLLLVLDNLLQNQKTYHHNYQSFLITN